MSKEGAEGRRLIELETKISYQEKTIAELNDALVGLNRAATDFERRLRAVESVIQSDFERRDVPNQPPPHY